MCRIEWECSGEVRMNRWQEREDWKWRNVREEWGERDVGRRMYLMILLNELYILYVE